MALALAPDEGEGGRVIRPEDARAVGEELAVGLAKAVDGYGPEWDLAVVALVASVRARDGDRTQTLVLGNVAPCSPEERRPNLIAVLGHAVEAVAGDVDLAEMPSLDS